MTESGSAVWRRGRRALAAFVLLVSATASAQPLTLFGYDDAGNLLSVRQTDMRTDPSNCGSPGKVCAGVDHGTAACAASTCTIECSPGYLLGANLACGSASSRGVRLLLVPFDEFMIPIPTVAPGSHYCGGAFVLPASDPDNCGSCGVACPAVRNASRTCAAGVCGFSCNPGYTLCNGACVSLADDRANCGRCGKVCPATGVAAPYCEAGVCRVSCPALSLPIGDHCAAIHLKGERAAGDWPLQRP